MMVLNLILDVPDDIEHHAVRVKVKLDALKLIHEINSANRKGSASDDDDTDDDDDSDFAKWKATKP